MSDAAASLRRKLDGAADLQSVVRTMKALAAANINQYEQSTRALAQYLQAVNLGLGACFRLSESVAHGPAAGARSGAASTVAVVFGSDQGLVGRFNEIVAEHALHSLADRPGKVVIWAVGERVHAQLADAARTPAGLFNVPGSVNAIAPLVGRILLECEAGGIAADTGELVLFYNHTGAEAGFEPVSERLLPLDENWRRGLAAQAWPTRYPPQVLGDQMATLRALIREFLFISLFHACAESLASENASRLAAMQRADQNIDELLEQLRGNLQRVRQGSIDEISGFEALSHGALR
jgi:F-type H+-transporting ATPase subunit gamma